jgi:hypothetical protein
LITLSFRVRSFSKAIVLYQYLLVQDQDRTDWESFSVANDGWMQEGVKVQNQDENYHGSAKTRNQTFNVNPCIHTFVETSFGPTPGNGPFMPSWQTYPVAPIYAPYNWDGAKYGPMVPLLDTLLQKKEIAMRVGNFPDENDPSTVGRIERVNHWAYGYIRDDEDPTEPMIEVYYPISTESRLSVTQPKDQNDEMSSSVVGVLASSLYWRDFLKDILQPGTGGVTAVFAMGGVTFTYAIDGPDHTYIGPGDRHDPKYDHLERYFSFGEGDFSLLGGQKYTGLPISKDSADFVIRVYPSPEMEEIFITSAPIVYTTVAALAFAITSALFIVYSLTVDRRQRKVMHTVVQTGANIVLLEKMVGERTKELEETNRRLEAASAAQLQHFAAMSHEVRMFVHTFVAIESLHVCIRFVD